MLTRIAIFVLLFLLLIATTPARAASEATAQPADWQFGADAYLWAAGMGGKTADGDTIDVPFDKLIDKLNLGFMGTVHMRYGRWHLSTDVLYMQLEEENNGQVTVPGGLNVKVNATAKMDAWVVTPVVGYSIIDTEQVRMEALAGARYLYMSVELDLLGPRGGSKNISQAGDVWNGIIGIRGNVNLIKNWYLPYYLDIGAGDSQFTWQAMAGVGYQINTTVDVVAAYRYLEWRFKDNETFDRLDMSGPIVGLRFRF
jgi:opacity protein-like surface antigen